MAQLPTACQQENGRYVQLGLRVHCELGRTKDLYSVLQKQCHTAKRISDRLRAEHGFDGGYTIVKDYVRERWRVARKMPVPLEHSARHAQGDFGRVWAIIGSKSRSIHFFIVSLPHSDGIFVKAYPYCCSAVHRP